MLASVWFVADEAPGVAVQWREMALALAGADKATTDLVEKFVLPWASRQALLAMVQKYATRAARIADVLAEVSIDRSMSL